MDNHLKDRLSAIHWFANIGCNSDIYKNLPCFNSVEDVSKSLGNSDWENVTLEEANRLSSFISQKHPVLFESWNDVAVEVRHYY